MAVDHRVYGFGRDASSARRQLRRGLAGSLVACIVLAVGAASGAASASANTVFLACGSHRNATPTRRNVKPRSCVLRAYDLTQLTYIDVEFRQLRWKRWGTARATARGDYAVSGLGWNPVSITASRRQRFSGKRPGRFYTRLAAVDTCACGFLGPGRSFALDTSPAE